MINPIRQEIEKKVKLVQELLVKARNVKQGYQVAVDQLELHGDVGPISLEADVYHCDALECRQIARSLLQEVEQANGRLFSQGYAAVPLKFVLKGKAFQQWAFYKALFGPNGEHDLWGFHQ